MPAGLEDKKYQTMWDHLRNALTTIVIVLAVTVDVSSSQAQPEQRFALVVGNGGYVEIDPLRNPARDAAGMADTLKNLGFNVTIGIDLAKNEFRKLLDEFVRDSSRATEILFFYAGHGFQLGNVNRLVPVDARLRSRDSIDAETISLNDVINSIKAKDRRSVILLDACRNNPLPAALRRPGDGEGLAKVDTGQDLFVAFATQPGNVALDGGGRHSPFTKALLTHMTREGMSISDMMVDLRKDVFISTQGTQIPWDQSSLRSQFYFSPTASLIDSRAAALRNNAAVDETPESPEPLYSVDEDLEPDATVEQPSAAGSDSAQNIPDPGGDAAIAEPPATTTGDVPVAGKKGNLKKTVVKAKLNKTAERPRQENKPTKAIRSARARPNALEYSHTIWGPGSMRSGSRRKKTEFGTLVCGNPSRIRGQRRCHWE